MEFQDAHGHFDGFAVDVFEQAARREGLRLSFVSSIDRGSNDLGLREGSIDIIPGGALTPERLREFYISKPWWWSEMVAVLPVSSPLRSADDLDGRRLAVVEASLPSIKAGYPRALLNRGPNARWNTGQVCAGRADAAIIQNIFLRELLLGLSGECRDISLRVIDIPVHREYRIVARKAAAVVAERLRRRIDELTVDGTLALIAARWIPVASPQATLIAELLRKQHEVQLRWIALLIAALASLAVIAFWFWQRRARQDLAAVVARLRSVLDNFGDRVMLLDPAGNFVYTNQSGHYVAGVQGQNFLTYIASVEATTLDGVTIPLEDRPLPRILKGENLRQERIRVLEAGKPERVAEISGTLIHDAKGKASFAVVTVRDVTESVRAVEARKHLELEFAQSQKMESIGRLAGGVAHDFNNLLTVINGYATLISRRSDLPPAILSPLASISKAGETAASLTRQLLAFSRKQVRNPVSTDLNVLIREMDGLLHSLLGDNVELVTRLDPGQSGILADRTQLQQIVMNLAANSRDAMPRGGRFTIETSIETCNAESSGGNVLLRISDTGGGMTAETLHHLFEPFFTTKPQGSGTGLGLATVYGIVRQNHGSIDVESSPGKGAIFHIRFPRTLEPPAESKPVAAHPVTSHAARILVVEDLEAVRTFLCTVLETSGYQVTVAAGADEALRLSPEFELLITDVSMPGLSGPELVEQLRHHAPALKVLFISGHPAEVLAKHGSLESDIELLEKPFSPEALNGRVSFLLSHG